MRSAVPAGLLGLSRSWGALRPGRPAHLTVLGADGVVLATVVAGRPIYRR
jgi:N-acetylglucosamine-6-phosphate deacetylase